MTHLHSSWFVTLVLESKADGWDESSFAAARRSDGTRLGVSVETYAYAPLREGSVGPELVTVLHHEGPLPEDLGLSDAGSKDPRIGTYVHRNEVVGSVPLEEAPRAGGLLLGITDCGDPARIDEFHRFYDENHAADVVRSPFYDRGDRYERVHGDLGDFLALYTTTLVEPDAFRGYLAWPERDKSRCEVFVVKIVGTYRRIG